jgi:hypothetical protein
VKNTLIGVGAVFFSGFNRLIVLYKAADKTLDDINAVFKHLLKTMLTIGICRAAYCAFTAVCISIGMRFGVTMNDSLPLVTPLAFAASAANADTALPNPTMAFSFFAAQGANILASSLNRHPLMGGFFFQTAHGAA